MITLAPSVPAGALAVLLLITACGTASEGSPEREPPEREPPSRQAAERGSQPQEPETPPPAPRGLNVEKLKVKVLASFPHDPTAFCQGLVWDGGFLYESTGLWGRSTVRRVDPADGRILAKRALGPEFFGEGLALVDDRLIQLTWKAGVALVYDPATLELVDQYGYNGEGWGLADDGERLVMSNGSALLTFRDRQDFRWLASLEVTRDGVPLRNVNELEFAEGHLYANIWGEDRIVRIDADTGEVLAEVDASGLLTRQESRMVDVLNGIAYDPVSRTFWLTGKFWHKMFQVVFEPVG